MPIKVLTSLCNGCCACIDTCQQGAFTVKARQAVVDLSKCQECEECIFNCPQGAITFIAESQSKAD